MLLYYLALSTYLPTTPQKKKAEMRKSTMIMMVSCMPLDYGHCTTRRIIRSFATAFVMPQHYRSTRVVTAKKNANSWTASLSMMIHQLGHDYYLSSPPPPPIMSSTRSMYTSTSSSRLYTCTTPESHNGVSSSTNTDSSSSSVDEEEWNVDNDSHNMIDPYSDQAFIDFSNFYTHHNIAGKQQQQHAAAAIDVRLAHDKLLRLTESVVFWNERLNLISRRDCNPTMVYHRHVLPSVALLPLIVNEINNYHHTNNNNNYHHDDDINNNNTHYNNPADINNLFNIIDVGTGGGFPGLPLALLLPTTNVVQFTLVDSIKKKLLAVSAMASELDVNNVRFHHGRVEEMYINQDTGKTNQHHYKYDIVLGRSVTALPRFCCWITNLIKQEPRHHHQEGGGGGGGKLIYIIGGDLDEIVSSRIVQDVPIDELLCRTKVMSDKRALLFNAQDVYEIARNSGEEIIRTDVVVVRNNSSSSSSSRNPPPPPPFTATRRKSKVQQNSNTGDASGKAKPLAKGAWSKKQNDVKKQRGYNDFKRYES